MRLDKYLKVARVLKRRSISKELADNQRIMVNGKVAKPATNIEVGDVIEITFGNRVLAIKVLMTADHIKKDDASMLYEVISSQEL